MGFCLAALWPVATATGAFSGLGGGAGNLLPNLHAAILAHPPLQFFISGIYLSELFIHTQGPTSKVFGYPCLGKSFDLCLAV